MSVMDAIDTRCIRIDSQATEKSGVLREIADLCKKSDLLRARKTDDIYAALAKREKTGTTGFGDGIAIPHCSFPDIDDFVVGLMTFAKGVEFESLDGKPVFLLFFIIGPARERNRHIQILSTISKLLLEKGTIRKINKAKTIEDIVGIIRGETSSAGEPMQKQEKCLFQIVVQREEYFDQIMQILSAEVQGEIAVIEAYNAGHYLNRIPLFAAYWGEEKSRFTRLVLAVTDKAVCNDVIRRIHLISDDLERERGVLIAVQDLIYAGGSLDF